MSDALEGGGKSKGVFGALVEVAYWLVPGMESLSGIAAAGRVNFLKQKKTSEIICKLGGFLFLLTVMIDGGYLINLRRCLGQETQV